MARLLDSLRHGRRDIATVEDYVAALNSFQFGGGLYGFGSQPVTYSSSGVPVEPIPSSFSGYSAACQSNGVVFACMLARMQVFSAVRFQFQQYNHGRPGRLFGNTDLTLLEEPWVGGTTQDLLVRHIQDADLAGNSFWTVDTPLPLIGTDVPGELVRLRPDWVTIVMAARRSQAGPLGYRKIGYAYQEAGDGDAAFLDPSEVSHFAPIPDPLATYRGMSWLTPVVRETQTDNQLNRHKQQFVKNSATPNLSIVMDASITPEKFERFKALFERDHRGVDRAGETLFLGGGADVTVVGSDFRKMDLKNVQGAGETRIAAAAGVPPIIVGLSEGLASATYSNYGQARRRYADGTIHPLWANVAGSLSRLVRVPLGSRLYYDARDVPFLREDELDSSAIQLTRAQTVRTLIDAGYTPDSVARYAESNDYADLVHTGLFSVQLQEPGADQNPARDRIDQRSARREPLRLIAGGGTEEGSRDD